MDNLRLKEAQYRQNKIGNQFLSTPPDDIFRVFVNGEIVSAEDFPESQLFISYKVTLPLGWKSQISEEYLSLDLSPMELKELNCLDSITQATLPIIQKTKDGGMVTKFFFSFPLDFQFLAKQNVVQWPVIHFEVFSKDNWDRILMHGCGFAKIPSIPGHHTIKVQTWKPIIDLKTRITQFFLGGLIKPKKLQEISKAETLTQMDELGPINRSQYNTLSSGKINIKINVLTQSGKVKADERVLYRDQKFSQQTQEKKKQFTQSNIPSFVNTGAIMGGRYTNVSL